MRAKGALMIRDLPFREIDLVRYPERRNDMVSLCDRFSVPQVFFNSRHIGGADDLLELLEEWKNDKSKTLWEHFCDEVYDFEDPTDERLEVYVDDDVSTCASMSSLGTFEDMFDDEPRNPKKAPKRSVSRTISRTSLNSSFGELKMDPDDLPTRLDMTTTLTEGGDTVKEFMFKSSFDDVGGGRPARRTSVTLMTSPSPDETEVELHDAAIALPSSRSVDNSDAENCVKLPNGQRTSVIKIMKELDRILDSQNRPYNAHLYKNCFINTEAVIALQVAYRLPAAEDAVEFGKYLQKEHGILHHVCDDHEFQDGGYLFFRLQRYHQPNILNSFCIWKKEDPDPAFANVLIMRLKKLLYKVINRCTDKQGLVDYVRACRHRKFTEFEEATCELQRLNMAQLEESEKMAFGLNLYNLFITYAFVKVGIGVSGMGRGAFFGKVLMNIGGHLLSFNDLEHGILRANTKHPYATRKNFGKGDPRLPLALSKLDPRVHFALNCGAKSCPPIRFFRAESLEEELKIVSMSFCEKEEVLSLNEENHQVTLTMLLKWYGKDFCQSKDDLPETLLAYVVGKKKQKLERMVDKAKTETRPISIRFQSYDWTANASDFHPFAYRVAVANEFFPCSLVRKNSCM